MNYFAENGASVITCSFFLQRQNYPFEYRVNNATDFGNILNSLEKIKATVNKSKFIGFVDNDKDQHPYATNFMEGMPFKSGVSVKKFENQYLILVDPAIDLFIFENAQEVEIDFRKYKLPGSFKPFKAQMKSEGIHSNKEFKSLLNDLYQKKCSCFVALQEAFDFIYSQK